MKSFKTQEIFFFKKNQFDFVLGVSHTQQVGNCSSQVNTFICSIALQPMHFFFFKKRSRQVGGISKEHSTNDKRSGKKNRAEGEFKKGNTSVNL